MHEEEYHHVASLDAEIDRVREAREKHATKVTVYFAEERGLAFNYSEGCEVGSEKLVAESGGGFVSREPLGDVIE